MEGARIANRYLLQRRLGRGGMGDVWLARDETLRREVAVKLLLVDAGQERLLREARTLAGIRHPGVVQVHDAGVHEGRMYVVMERVVGETLRGRVGTVGAREAIDVLREVGAALQVAHAAGVVHRDVKPDNVMVREDGRLVLLDFGLARESSAVSSAATDEATVQRLTESGAFMGTPGYMSPEQARGRGVGPATDQFALAVMGVELVTGSLPWRGDTPADVLVSILRDEPDLGGLSEPLRSTLARALRKSPEERFIDLDAMLSALDPPPRAPAPSEGTSPRGLAMGLTGALVLAGLVAAGWWMSTTAPSSPPGDTASAPAGLVWGQARVGCPQLAVDIDGVGPWLGAAVASDACAYLWIPLGGPPGNVEPPAALLGLPAEPGAEGPEDPYAEPDARDRQLRAASELDAWIDGVVTERDGQRRVRVALIARGGHTLAEVDVPCGPATCGVTVTEALRERGGLPQRDALEPSIAAVFGLESVSSALTVYPIMRPTGQAFESRAERCAAVRRLPDVRREVARDLPEGCRPVNPIDARQDPADETARDLAAAMEAYRRGMARLREGDPSLARAAAIESLRRWPAGLGWAVASTAFAHDDSALAVYRGATYWMPEFPGSWTLVGQAMEPGSDAELEMTRRGYTLQPEIGATVDLAALLWRRGRISELLRVAAPHADVERSVAGPMMMAMADAGRGHVRAALARARALIERDDWELGSYEHQDIVLIDLVAQAAALTGSTDLVDLFVERFLLAETPRVRERGGSWRLRGATVLCGMARDAIARACLDRLDALASEPVFAGSSAGSIELLRGVRAWRAGDASAAAPFVRGFVTSGEAWDAHLFGLVVSPILAEAGELALARRHDRATLATGDRHFRGAGAVTVRAAIHASEAGDEAQARALAARAVEALSLVDVEIAELDRLRAIAAP